MRKLIAASLVCLAPISVGAQEFTTLKGHGGPIMALDVSPEGQVASASFDNSVGLWTGQEPLWLEGHSAAVTALTFGPNGSLFSGGDDFAFRIWGDDAREIGRHKGKITDIDIAPNGSSAATSSWDGTIGIWSFLDGRVEERFLKAPAGVNAVAYAPDNEAKTLFAATSTGELLRYDLDAASAPIPIARHGFGINRMIVTPEWIAYGAVDGGTRVISPETGVQIADFTLDRRPILSMDHHAPSGQLAVGDGHGFIMMIDTREWRITRDFRAARDGPVWALAFSPDGRSIYAGGLDDVVYAWPVALLDEFEPGIEGARSFLRDPETMTNGERQFMRKCSICHALEDGPSRKAGPTLYGVFGRSAGAVPGYRYSSILANSDIVWRDETIDALFEEGPDHYIPGSKMPMQVIAKQTDRADLIAFLKDATTKE